MLPLLGENPRTGVERTMWICLDREGSGRCFESGQLGEWWCHGFSRGERCGRSVLGERARSVLAAGSREVRVFKRTRSPASGEREAGRVRGGGPSCAFRTPCLELGLPWTRLGRRGKSPR